MFDILTLLPGKKKRTQGGWHSFNAVCCHNRGHKADKRGRGGIIFEGDTNWTYNCFNCGFKAKFALGKTFSIATKQILFWCGYDKDQIDEWNLYSLRHKGLLDLISPKRSNKKSKFDEIGLPDNAELIDTTNIRHAKFIAYLKSRGMKHDDYPFMITPDDPGRNADRIIIPYTFKNKIVGHISRVLDDRLPKYIKSQQPGYVFGYDFQKDTQEVCIVVEGVFDALSLDACAITHDTISDEQAALLMSLHKQIIVVPDLDKAGLTICDRALELGFQVSIPEWGHNIKDANDAVIKYGRLATLLSILQSATRSKIKVDMAKRKFNRNKMNG